MENILWIILINILLNFFYKIGPLLNTWETKDARFEVSLIIFTNKAICIQYHLWIYTNLCFWHEMDQIVEEDSVCISIPCNGMWFFMKFGDMMICWLKVFFIILYYFDNILLYLFIQIEKSYIYLNFILIVVYIYIFFKIIKIYLSM